MAGGATQGVAFETHRDMALFLLKLINCNPTALVDLKTEASELLHDILKVFPEVGKFVLIDGEPADDSQLSDDIAIATVSQNDLNEIERLKTILGVVFKPYVDMRQSMLDDAAATHKGRIYKCYMSFHTS